MFTKEGFIYIISALLITIPLHHTVNNIILILLFLYAFSYAIVNKVKPKFSYISFYFFALYFLIAVSYFWSINKHLSQIGLERKVLFALVPLLFAFIPKFNKVERNKIFAYFSKAMFAYALFFILLGLLHYYNTGSTENLRHHALVSPLGLNRIYVSILTVTALFYLIIDGDKTFLNKLMIISLVIFLILLSSKTIILSSTFLLIMYYFNKVELRNKKWLYLVIPVAFIGIIWISNKVNKKFISELIPNYKEIITKTDFGPNYYFNGAELRMLYTRFLLEYEIENPKLLLIGFGTNATQQKINEKCIKYNLYEGYGVTYNFHNQYNQFLAEMGIVGLGLFLYILYYGLKKAFLNKDSFMLLVLSVLSILLFTETMFNRQRGMYFFLFMYMLLIHSQKTNSIDNPNL